MHQSTGGVRPSNTLIPMICSDRDVASNCEREWRNTVTITIPESQPRAPERIRECGRRFVELELRICQNPKSMKDASTRINIINQSSKTLITTPPIPFLYLQPEKSVTRPLSSPPALRSTLIITSYIPAVRLLTQAGLRC